MKENEREPTHITYHLLLSKVKNEDEAFDAHNEIQLVNIKFDSKLYCELQAMNRNN